MPVFSRIIPKQLFFFSVYHVIRKKVVPLWVKFNANPNGNHVGDCTVRAISKATGKSWDRTFCEIVVTAFDMKDMPESNRVWGEYLRRCGYVRNVLPADYSSCCTVEEFCNSHKEGNYILAVDGHVIACSSGDFFDTWDSSREIIICFWEVK